MEISDHGELPWEGEVSSFIDAVDSFRLFRYIKTFCIESWLIEGYRLGEDYTEGYLDHIISEHQRAIYIKRIDCAWLDKWLANISGDTVREDQKGATSMIRDKAGMDVSVGGHSCPAGGPEIKKRLSRLLRFNNTVPPTASAQCALAGAYDEHSKFQFLHPFMDGNGRSGRMLWLRHMYRAIGAGVAHYGFLHYCYYHWLGDCSERMHSTQPR